MFSPSGSAMRRLNAMLPFFVLSLYLIAFTGSVQASSLRSTTNLVFTKLADLTRPQSQKEAGNSPYVTPMSAGEDQTSTSFGTGWETVNSPVVRLFDGRINQPGFAVIATGSDGKGGQLALNSTGIFPNTQKVIQSDRVHMKQRLAFPGVSTFTPINPPSIPLAVRGPYLSAWLPSGSLLSATPPNNAGNGGYLAGQYPAFWTSGRGADGDFRLGTHGYIRIDNTTYQFMGDGFGNIVRAGKNANQLSMEYTSTRTIFKFEAAGVLFTVTFFTPITPNDFLRQSLPLSYIHFELDKLSATFRKVQVYFDIDERWITGHEDYQDFPYVLDFKEYDGTQQYFLTRTRQQFYTEFRQRAEWGSTSWAIRDRPGVTSLNQNNVNAQLEFLVTGALSGEHFGIGGPDNSFAFAVDMNAANATNDILLSIGHFRSPYINLVKANTSSPSANASYQQDRYGYWQSEFSVFADAVKFFLDDFESALANATAFDKKVAQDSKAVVGGGIVGNQYAAITTLSVRQALGALELTISRDPKTKKWNTTDTIIGLKEISSNGDSQTVDVIYPTFPILSYLNPAWIPLLLNPIFEYTESGLYPNKWAVHDLGTWPNLVGYPKGNDEPMQVEESGNMIIMTLHWAQLAGKKTAIPYLKKHYKIMAQWASFLIEDSLIPASQLSTDDFAGTASNQTNLAIKGLIGIAAMGEIASLVGQSGDAAIYRNISQQYASAWQFLAVDKAKTHTKLLYQQDDSWGTLYNAGLERWLNLALLPKSIYDMQDKWYPKQQQKYGVPLDSRHQWTKSDWALFSASVSGSISTRNLFISLLYKFWSDGKTGVPMTDLYETTTGDSPKYPYDPTVNFLARPVVGGHFALLAKQAADKANGVTNAAYGPNPTKTSYTDAELMKLIQDSEAMQSKLSTAGTAQHRRRASRQVLEPMRRKMHH
ncbi:hypothetical protein OC846_000166 [Tilletia horrida]|uniref:Glutaminase A n=1 Tax=Tilletia horrida TaxID=155126 RepID=A0AAN6K145_9BASI|nr:hypothetical protein OC846_000166 [Tilletia horrida]KAK0570084.1 hypothetical protein OC861_000225 [Tilletia horrida]